MEAAGENAPKGAGKKRKTTNCVTKSDICWHRNYALRYHSSLLR